MKKVVERYSELMPLRDRVNRDDMIAVFKFLAGIPKTSNGQLFQIANHTTTRRRRLNLVKRSKIDIKNTSSVRERSMTAKV